VRRHADVPERLESAGDQDQYHASSQQKSSRAGGVLQDINDGTALWDDVGSLAESETFADDGQYFPHHASSVTIAEDGSPLKWYGRIGGGASSGRSDLDTEVAAELLHNLQRSPAKGSMSPDNYHAKYSQMFPGTSPARGYKFDGSNLLDTTGDIPSPDLKFAGMNSLSVDSANNASFSPSQFFGDGLSSLNKPDSPRTPGSSSRPAPRRLAMESADRSHTKGSTSTPNVRTEVRSDETPTMDAASTANINGGKIAMSLKWGSPTSTGMNKRQKKSPGYRQGSQSSRSPRSPNRRFQAVSPLKPSPSNSGHLLGFSPSPQGGGRGQTLKLGMGGMGAQFNEINKQMAANKAMHQHGSPGKHHSGGRIVFTEC
jgi:hypothetical protein